MILLVLHSGSCVHVVSSFHSGMGKSLYIERMAEELDQQATGANLVTVPIHGPLVSADMIMEFLKEHFDTNRCTIFHFDIAPNVRNLKHMHHA